MTTPALRLANLEVRDENPPKERGHASQTELLRTDIGSGCGRRGNLRCTDCLGRPGRPIPYYAQQSCTGSGAGTICQSPGNNQINDAPPPVQFFPYGGEAFLL